LPVIDGSLEQGDLFFDFPLLKSIAPYEFPLSSENLAFEVEFANIVILTQTCDLSAEKIDNVLVCPHFSVEELAGQVEELAGKKGRERVRQGSRPSLYSLPPSSVPEFTSATRIVGFRQLSAVPFEFLRAFADQHGPHLRLVSPYREHLAQALARFLGRIALPVDYPEF
jgi:hypothetical protein